MLNPTNHQIRSLCHKRIAARRSAAKEDARLEARVAELVKANLDSGRFQRVAFARSRRHPLTLAQYVDRVIDCAIKESARIQALEEGDEAEWNRLVNFLFRRAYRTVRRFRSGTEANAATIDFAQQACLVIFEERYPFDVAFDAWATVILKNLVLAHYTRSPDVLNRPYSSDSLDQPQTSEEGGVSFLDELIANPQSLAPFEKVENLQVLLKAIHQLRSQAQQRVIVATFLEELDDAQIAKELGKRKQAIYNLRKRALAGLKEILDEKGAQEFGLRFHKRE